MTTTPPCAMQGLAAMISEGQILLAPRLSRRCERRLPGGVGMTLFEAAVARQAEPGR